MKGIRKHPSQSELQERFLYSKGRLIYRYATTNCHKGSVAGYKRVGGYIVIGFKGESYMASRLVYIYHYGDISDDMDIDHKDQNKSNNRITNLRELSRVKNCHNISKPKNNTSGHIGISWDKVNDKWEVSIKVNYKKIRLGRFENIDEAVLARKAGEKKYSPLHQDI